MKSSLNGEAQLTSRSEVSLGSSGSAANNAQSRSVGHDDRDHEHVLEYITVSMKELMKAIHYMTMTISGRRARQKTLGKRLILAAQRNDILAVRRLIRKGADLEYADKAYVSTCWPTKQR